MSVELFNTRVDEDPSSYSHALIEGLAYKGGLYTPGEIPELDQSTVEAMGALPYDELATQIIGMYSDLPKEVLRDINSLAYAPDNFSRRQESPEEPMPYVHISNGVGMVELFNGPTFAFKDAALQVVPHQMDHVLKQTDSRLTIVSATSGDTGSAAMDGIRQTERLDGVILSPPNMADVQKGQMGQRSGGNILNLRVDGVFDDCQDLVKALNGEPGFEDLGALNSINWGRVVAQIPYYFSTYYQTLAQEGMSYGEQIDVIVPSGNFGNALAAYIAREMGVPIREIVLATNENDVLHDLVQTGTYSIAPSEQVIPTDAPSMDIGKVSNFERLAYWAFDNDPERVTSFLRDAETAEGGMIGNYVASGDGDALKYEHGLESHATGREQRSDAMKAAYYQAGVFIDQHTATAMHAAFIRRADTSVPQIVMATASVHKFEDEAQDMFGENIPLPERPDALRDVEQYADRFVDIPNDLTALKLAVEAFRNREK